MTHIHRNTTPMTEAVASEIEQVLGLDKQKEMAQSYAAAFDPENGDTLREYAELAARSVYPSGVSRFNGERANFKGLVRHYIRERQKAAQREVFA